MNTVHTASSQDKAVHWVSRCLFLGPRVSEEERSIVPLSFHLGSRSISNLRLIIVRNANETSLSGLVLESWTDACIERRQASQSGARYRDVLRARRSTLTRFANTPVEHPETSPADSFSSTITIIYEIVRPNPHRIAFIGHPDLSQHTHSPVVLYDYTYSVDKDRNSLLVYVESSIPVILFNDLHDWDTELEHTKVIFPWNEPKKPKKIPSIMYAISVEPVSRRSRASPPLPMTALRRIALNLIEDRPPNWRQQLLALGVICKGWAPLLDIFFEMHCRSVQQNFGFGKMPMFSSARPELPELFAVARSLNRGRPERALLINKFSLSYYRESTLWPRLDQAQRKAVLSAAAYVLDLAQSIKEVYFSHVEFLDNDDIFGAFWRLHDLETVVVEPNNFYGLQNPPIFPLEDVQELATGWPNLRLFAWKGTRINHASGDQPIFEPGGPSEITLKCSLEELSMNYDRITDIQFLRFFEVPETRLVDLNLEAIHGITNHALYTALSTVTNTLTRLRLFDCGIEKPPGEEYALDALSHRLPSLDIMVVSANTLSSLTIKRRVQGQYRVPAHLRIFHINDPTFLNDFADAITESGRSWRYIMTSSRATFSRENLIVVNQINHAAWRAGVYFNFVGESRRAQFGYMTDSIRGPF